MPAPRIVPVALTLALAALGGCVDEVTVPAPEVPGELAPGQTRTIELRFLRFDVDGFQQVMTIDDVRALPKKTLDELWLLDFHLGETLDTVLAQLRDMSPSEADGLPQAARNMRNLLNMTPDNASLVGTKLEEAVSLAGTVGIPPAKVLAAIPQIMVTDNLVPPDIVSEVVLELLVGSHPVTQFRKGPVTDEHPDGLYPVAPGSIPMTLADLATNFASLADRFGPTPLDPNDPMSPVHPGFIDDAYGISIVEEDFKMSVKVSVNALPFKGVDLGDLSVASVNSIASQVDTLFDFNDPEWMTVEGLADEMVIQELTMSIHENDKFVLGGDARDPKPNGNSEIWDLPPWEFERLIMESAARRTALIAPHCDEYKLATDTLAFEACIDAEGWTELTTFADIGDPPPPAYFWDILVEVAQVRLHDGGLAEGDADVQFTLTDVRIPIDPDALLEQIKENFQRDPSALASVAERVNDAAEGDADFFYYQPERSNSPNLQGDYLYFVTEADIRKDAEALPVREYTYARPGFFADPDLSDKVSNLQVIDGDETHEKIKVVTGDVLYMEDDAGRRFKLSVGEKPSPSRISLEITRI
ncbi:MAG: acetyltransferase [Myxococcales bacterium]|nr:acetyltransferase [Myxococcales bacterium]